MTAAILELWPIISAVAVLFAMIISFKSETLIRLRHIEEKIRKADEGRKAEENAKRARENGKEGDIHVPTKKTRNEEE